MNSLAAMPSMHFAYSFIVGIVVVQWSGVFQNWRWRRGEKDGYEKYIEEGIDGEVGLVKVGDGMDVDEMAWEKSGGSRWTRLGMWVVALGGVAYPTLVLTAIVATANHVCNHSEPVLSSY